MYSNIPNKMETKNRLETKHADNEKLNEALQTARKLNFYLENQLPTFSMQWQNIQASYARKMTKSARNSVKSQVQQAIFHLSQGYSSNEYCTSFIKESIQLIQTVQNVFENDIPQAKLKFTQDIHEATEKLEIGLRKFEETVSGCPPAVDRSPSVAQYSNQKSHSQDMKESPYETLF